MKHILNARTSVAVALLLWGATACDGDNSGEADSGLGAMVWGCRSTISGETPGAFVVADEGHSILVDTDNDNGDISMLACILVKTGASEALIHDMDATSALMGRQHAEEHGYTYEWSYHPDSGINMTITDK